jgi:hypothetical protein
MSPANWFGSEAGYNGRREDVGWSGVAHVFVFNVCALPKSTLLLIFPPS